MVVGDTVPAGGIFFEFFLVEDLSGFCSGRWWNGCRRAGSEKERRKKKEVDGFHGGILSEM
jgi:hypothetical protein